jgi:RNA polymerase sigma-70 factor (ECF subfamily)
VVVRPGIGCQGSARDPDRGRERLARLRPVQAARERRRFEPWALQVLEIEDGKVVEFSFFLDTETLFPLFGLPLEFDA